MAIGHFDHISVTPLKVPNLKAQNNKKAQKPCSRFFRLKTKRP